jgi:hypothetical protein
VNTLFPTNTPERCDQLIRAARLRRVAREAANAAWLSAALNNFRSVNPTASDAALCAVSTSGVGSLVEGQSGANSASHLG